MLRLFLSFRCVGLKEWQQQQQQVRQQTQNNDKKKHFDVEIREKQIVDEPEINQTTSLPPFHNPQNQKYLRRKNS